MDDSPCFEVRYVPLSGRWPVVAFPCDAQGSVHLDSLSRKVLDSYYFARAVVGFAYAPPSIARRDA